MIISIGFVMAMGLTALVFVLEKKEGTLDRTWAAGVTPAEVLIAHISTEFVVMCIQIGLLLFFALFVVRACLETACGEKLTAGIVWHIRQRIAWTHSSCDIVAWHDWYVCRVWGAEMAVD
jgi:hypothetical protein